MHKGFTVWFTGLSGSGKTTCSRLLVEHLKRRGAKAELLDGDEVRQHLCRGLGFSKEDRDENVRRIGYVCELLCRNGVVAIVAAISPYRDAREQVRASIHRLIEVYMECPVEVLIQNDVKGLYKRALAGEIRNFSGVSDPYEPPIQPEVTIRTYQDTLEDGVTRILAKLQSLGLLAASLTTERRRTRGSGSC
jgi:adenylyl-sulfate kinase